MNQVKALDLGGIVLSGGKSTRMGQDKGFVLFDDKPLVQYAIDLLEKFTPDIIISANHEEYKKLGYPVVEDKFTDCGPVAGLYSSLKASSHDWNLILSCDVPLVNEEVLTLLLDQRRGKGAVPVHEGKLEPLVALYHRDLYKVFEKSIKNGNFQLRGIIKQAEIHLVSFDDLMTQNPRLFDNFNTPGDLKR
ncbi:molybdenum cofactor guanylyltransferase [Prolixibacter denitrificans]|uniref:Probable molybdenum cofactor guanylyltransferase n=1 Tax=Prolixibacter denitrificans TaxID=1541063 RepID=A0A2P8CKX1_9BACT|nr:molybdenum cofactor guanylyltransferase [Prolixibacter denitrificans]PSK85619.1 molybdopterin-guanine dinucleotide biosynthesis protein A [Prolixibacter denitrificans]GET20239.1 molybdenum cofactor guanylyltransferase [Prolixibacter denitrificans]